jgi:hypothetical protein
MKNITLLLSLTLTLASTAQAAVRLPATDCAKTPSDARCKFSDSPTRAGKTGTGLPFALGGFELIGSGYVDEASNSLLVPVEFGSRDDNEGVVMRVDLATGNRTIVSGYDGEESKGTGVAYVSDRGYKSEAYGLNNVRTVRPGPSGSILALVGNGRGELIKIDSKTGNRSLIWASKVFNDAAPSGPTAIRDIEAQRFNFSSNALCRGGGQAALSPSATFETDGQFAYLFMANNPAGTGIGLVKVPLNGGSCTWVSQYWPDGKTEIGSGPTVNTLSPMIYTSGLIGREFVAATGPNPTGNTLFAINTQTGERRTMSLNNVITPARSKGAGEAEVGYFGTLAIGSAGIATLRGDVNSEYFEPVMVNPQTGDRKQLSTVSGSLKDVRDSSSNIVAAIPGTSKFIVAFGKALHVWDSKTGASFLLSQ